MFSRTQATAAHLIGEHHQIAADVLHPGEIGHHVMRPGAEEHLGRRSEVLRAPAAPGAAMDEDKDRRRHQPAAVDVEPFDLGRSVGDPLGLADAPSRHCAVGDAALDQLLSVERVSGLIIGRVECGLVMVEEYRRAFFGHRSPAICDGRRDRPRTNGERA